MLPKKITSKLVDKVAGEFFDVDYDVVEQINNGMDVLFEDIAVVLAERFGLSDEQRVELVERMSFKVVLLPAS